MRTAILHKTTKRVAALCMSVMLLAALLGVCAPVNTAHAADVRASFLLESVSALQRTITARTSRAAAPKNVPQPNPNDPLATTPVIEVVKGALEVRYYSESTAKFKVRIAAEGSGKFSNYDLYVNNATQRYGLPANAKAVIVQICENISGTKYSIKHEVTVSVTGGTTATQQQATQAPQQDASSSSAPQEPVDPNNPYLASVSDIAWSDGLISVAKARELANAKSGSKDKAEAVYNYLVTRLSYDFSKLGKLPSSYLPDMDDTYTTQKGICYDISSLYAGMLRSAGVPTKLCMGYTSMVEGYHAWNEVDLGGGKWQTVDVTTDCQLRGYGKSVSFSKPQGTFNATKSH